VFHRAGSVARMSVTSVAWMSNGLYPLHWGCHVQPRAKVCAATRVCDRPGACKSVTILRLCSGLLVWLFGRIE
jgi:hypothetical protein